MKKSLLIITALIAFACSKSPDFGKIQKGMKSTEVIKLIGKPLTKTTVFGGIQWWDYNTHMVVINSDTVVNCASKEEIEKGFKDLSNGLDSIQNALKSAIDTTISE